MDAPDGQAIRQQLTDDLKQAMRDKDEVRRDTVRNIRGSITNREVDSGAELDGAAILQVIRGLSKQRTDSIGQYEEGGRKDLADRERAEQAILEAYLPAAPNAADIDAAVTGTIDELGAQGIKDMGRVMKAALEKLGAAADGKAVSAAVRAKLQ